MSQYVPLKNFPQVSFAPKLLYDTVVADKITLPVEAYSVNESNNWGIVYSNIGAFQINNDTWKYIGNIFSMLEFPWGNIPQKMTAVMRYLETHYAPVFFRQFQFAFHKNMILQFNRMTAYRLFVGEIDFTKYDKIIFYGCGHDLRNFMKTRYSPLRWTGPFPVYPDEIWDMNADTINSEDITFLSGIPLKKPNFNKIFICTMVPIFLIS
jgi:hypothetical protein